MTSADEARLLTFRDQFPTLETSVHLISHSLGAMPKQARVWGSRYLDEWQQDSITAWDKWLPFVTDLGDCIGKVLGVEPGSVVMSQNVSTLQAIVSSALDFSGERRGVVYSDLNFPSVHYVWEGQRARGAEITVVPSKDGIEVPLEDLLAAIDERTLIVPISHVLFRSSALQDLKTIVDHAHKVGAMVFVDCYQSAGAIPLALGELGVDLACGGSVKWACGGAGASYLYVRPDLLPRFKPTFTGWFGHARPFAFEMEMTYADSAWRMLGGTPAIPALYTARAGWELLNEVGVEAIRAKSLRQTELLMGLCDERGFKVGTPREADRRGGTVCFDFDGSGEVGKALNGERFFCDHRPGCGLRASPHYYTTDEELHRFIGRVDELRKR